VVATGDCGADPVGSRGYGVWRWYGRKRATSSDAYQPFSDGIPQYFEWSTIGPDGVPEAETFPPLGGVHGVL
jgi:hypothetical protein